MKKLASLALALVIILSLSVTAFAAEDTLYLDISEVLDSTRTLSSVTGKVYISMSGMKPVSITHVSGTIYSCDKTSLTTSSEGEFWVIISYESGDDFEFRVVTSNMGDNNLYAPTGGYVGTWRTYTPAPTGPSVTNGSQNVTGKYVAEKESNPIYKVDISWGGMAFTYTAASKGIWKTDSHTYEGATTAKWTWESGANEIKVTNHSNDGITVTPSYTKDNGYEDASMTFVNAPLTLGTADNGENGAAGTATSGTITVTPSGSVPEGTSGKIGQITLAIASSSSSGSNTPSNDKATITGFYTTVGGTKHTSGTVTVSDTNDWSITFTGTNLNSVTDENKYGFDYNGQFLSNTFNAAIWNANEFGTEITCSQDLAELTSLFTTEREFKFSNDGGSTWTGSGVKIIYDASGSTTVSTLEDLTNALASGDGTWTVKAES